MNNRINHAASQIKEYHEWALLAQKQTGKSLSTQLREILALRRESGQCGASDYYWHNLYNDDYMLGRGKKDFLGWRLSHQLSLSLNDRESALPGVDKLAFKILAASAGLPTVPVVATFHRAIRLSELLGIHLRNKEAVSTFLRDQSVYPLFGKPAYSLGSYGAAYLISYDPESDTIQLIDGSSIRVDSFMRRLDESVDRQHHKPQCGYLFQIPLKPAIELLKFTNWSAISGVRIICLNGADGVKPIRAVWKISVPPNYQDNFGMGEFGNLMADVNLKSGEISRMLRGVWPKAEILTKHPLSGQAVSDFRLPHWDRVLDICRQGGALFPLLKIQHWDFALTDQGPVILELNDFGGTQIVQMHGRGLLTEETREFLKRHVNAKKYSWVEFI